MHQELKRKGVTLQLLWEEYTVTHGERGYRYSQFCAHYHQYRGTLARWMRQVHRAGEKVFIDYSGDTVAVIDARTGEVRTAEIFVATLGASKYAYAEATWTQMLPAGPAKSRHRRSRSYRSFISTGLRRSRCWDSGPARL